MSVFTNPAVHSADQAKAYTSAILDLLGRRDPMDVLAATPAELEEALDRLSHTQITKPEAAGKWSIRHVLQHLADSELVWGWRLRLVLAQNRPPLTGYDQDLWADRLGYAAVEAEDAVQDFTVLRNANLRLLSRVKPTDLDRVGVHVERGEESVRHMIRLYAGHDLMHLQQIERIRKTVS